ncbi:class A beta-lactamase [Streptomyces caatingaensis]|uniref:Beta-lactamase n=1 Tax=Streptomyces caatingaensis TaxID=1678637 RepID=A0A0K9XIQ2_9ACTN|nr:class A beta-lactamase [Streptomyces caatingaensis]KNB53269.1 beta-lactamase [Streptomyces caatingaensis]
MTTTTSRMVLFVAPLTAALLVSGCTGRGSGTGAEPSAPAPAAAPFRQLEQRFGARVGLYALDTGTGREVTYRADERFAHCSTFKALAAGALLHHASDAELDQVVTYRPEDLQKWAPIARKHVATGMKLREVAAAAAEYSDNTAANLLLDHLGGPAGLQKELRGIGDSTISTDRTEPGLSDAVPGDTRDTSTPRSIATDLRRYVLGSVLSDGRRQLLTDWLVHNTTGDRYIRAGVPAGWKVGDRTGNGGYGTRNDIAVAWPPGRSPVVIAVLSDRGEAGARSDDALIAEVTKAAVQAL